MKIPKELVLGLVMFWAAGSVSATETVIQKEISVSRALAGHILVWGTEEPANGAIVELCSPDWKAVLASTKTDEKGYFSLEEPSTGKLFNVRVSAPGMNIYELRVRIKKTADKELTIRIGVAT